MTADNRADKSAAAENSDTTPLDSSRFSHTFRALRHRNYQLFFVGQLVSLSGTWMQSVALAWLVYKLTNSAALLGLVGFSGQIPVFLFAAFGGALADRFNRHRILVVTQSAAMILAFTLAFLTLFDYIQIWQIFAIAAGFGVINAFDIPTRQAFVPDMVGREDLINAIALNSSMFNGARIVGPAIAGVLVASVGEAWCFLINAVSYIAVIAGLLLMKVESKKHAAHKDESIFAGIIGGFRFVGTTSPVRALMLLLGLVSLMGMPYAVLMPIFAKEIWEAARIVWVY